MQREFRLFGALSKTEDQPDGTLKVFGIASSGARDDAGEIVLPAAMKAALPAYALYPALREMHGPSAAGRTLEAEVDADGVTRIVAHVVDPVAVAKVKSRTYSGFSIGGKVLKRDRSDPTIITEIQLSEISLVDRPANPEAAISLWKRRGDVKAPVRVAEPELSAAEVLRRAVDQAREVLARGAPSPPEPIDSIDALVKRLSARGVTVGEDLAKYVVDLEDRLGKAESDLAKAQAESETLRKQPLPPRTRASTHTVVGKEEDSSPGYVPPGPTQDEFIRYVATLSEDERTMLLMKAAMRSPIALENR